MKAVQLKKPGDISLEERQMPVPKETESLIEVVCAGICGSDIGAFRGTNPLVSYPRIIGHEIAGMVVSIPKNEKGICLGDRVIVDPYLYCGTCYPCSLGRTNCCEHLQVLGVHIDGGMAQYFTHPADMLIKVPDGIDWDLIPMAEPLTIVLHGIHRLRVKAGEHIAVIGAGPIGLMAAMCALEYGAIPIILDPIEERLEFAKSMGIPYAWNPLTDHPEEKIRKVTNGRMAEAVMEASGANSAINMSFTLVSNAGRIAFTGWPKGATSIDTSLITKKELDVRGARTSAGEFEEALRLIAEKRINVQALLSKVVSLEEAPNTIRDIEKNPGNYLKVNVRIK